MMDYVSHNDMLLYLIAVYVLGKKGSQPLRFDPNHMFIDLMDKKSYLDGFLLNLSLTMHNGWILW